MSQPEVNEFQGWMGKDASAAKGNLVYDTFTPKQFESTDVQMKVSHCGICGSDLHTLRSGWGPTNYPCVVGHEIVGVVTDVGSDVKHLKVGDRAGVGAQSLSCLQPDCYECSNDVENHCQRRNVGTYNGKFKNPDGSTSSSFGGYASHWRGPAHFTFKLPDAITSAEAAPMLCGGVTVYSPLKRYGAGPGKTVGIIGIGGLGHFGLLFAKALGADKVVAISRTDAKKEDALKMGATSFIATDSDKDWSKTNANTIDLIVSTVSSPKMPFAEYLNLLKVHGTFIQVGAPEDTIPPFSAFNLIVKGVKFGGSLIGSPAEIREMLELAASQKIKPWIQERPMEEANKALIDFEAGNPRYRYVLANGKQQKL